MKIVRIIALGFIALTQVALPYTPMPDCWPCGIAAK
jgi:hypothetical protein